MRRKIKTKIKEILKTLVKAQDHVELLLQKRQLSQAGDLLAQCQECAVEAGGAIERSEGMGTEAVSCLELYCEQLYHMSQATDKKEVRSLKKQMENTLNQTRKLIDELPLDPMKVVFMPYKASMWDCMESVWEAAEADSGCDAYVVPIPFYEKNAQGGIEKQCYEGDIFPKYVPITYYNEFSLEAEQPDVIYIHNPYDDANYVTSVAPEYYSSNLKRYTDMLVYIPYYFNGSGPLPESHRDLSAYHYVEKIIMQDEEKAESLAESIPREKIAVLGSPKVDRLLKLEKKRQEIIENEIPEEWRKKIAGKKVILFNISVSGILQNSKYAMDKIQYVLSQFKGRDDVVLWWRPHPLIEGTLKSMRPEMYGEYMKIKSGFLKEGKGILDESGDAGIAAVVADAYLGENSSSLVHYFGVLGKPVMYTRWENTTEWSEEKRASLFFTDCFLEDNSIWFVPRSPLAYNYLCKMDLESGKVSLVYELPGEIRNPVRGGAYFGIIKAEDNIVLTPVWSSDIYIYRLNTNQAIKIPLKQDLQPNFARAFSYNRKIFLVPRNYPAVIELETDTGIIVYYDVPNNDSEVLEDAEFLFGVDSAVHEGSLYIPCVNKNAILIFNLDTKKFSEKKIKEVNCGFYSLSCIDGEIWVVGDKVSDIICWNINSDTVNVWREFPQEYLGGEQPFCKIAEDYEGILIFPKTANQTFRIAKDSHSITPYQIEGYPLKTKKKFLIEKNIICFLAVKEYKENIIALTEDTHKLLQYDKNTQKGILCACKLDNDERKRQENIELDRIFQYFSLPNAYTEDERLSIPVFLNYIGENLYQYHQKVQEKYQKILGGMDGDCGDKIHKFIKDELWKV